MIKPQSSAQHPIWRHATAHNVQLRGLIRFSYLSEGGFALSERGIDAVRDVIYFPERLERRFALFERLTLHSIKLQRESNFKIGILVGDTFPENARNRLKALLADVPQAQLITLPQMPHFSAIRRAYGMLGDDTDATHTATFRLDDDDAMHNLTTMRIQRLSTELLAIRNDKKPFAIAFNRGFYLDAINQQQPITEWYERTPLGVGLTLVAPKGNAVNVYRRNHRKLAEYYDCHTEIERPMYIRSVHMDNDSRAKANGRKGQLIDEEIQRSLYRGFGLTMDDLRGINVS